MFNFLKKKVLKVHKPSNSVNEKTKPVNEIEHYQFISGVINLIILNERELIENDVNKLYGFKCPKLFDNKLHIHFMIERFLYLFAAIKYYKTDLNLDEMKGYINSMSMKVYNLSNSASLNFIETRISFYEKELEMFSKFEHPHPGKIIWCLYNPSCDIISHDLKSKFEENYFAGIQLMQIIQNTFLEQLSDYKN